MSRRKIASGLLLAVVAVVASASAPSLAREAPVRTMIKLVPAIGPPTTPDKVQGRGYQAGETVQVTFDGAAVGSARVNGTGRFSKRVTIPATALPGEHTVEATGITSGLVSRATFTVRTDWLQSGFDAARSSRNPYENVLDTENVGSIKIDWVARAGADGTTSPAYASGKILTGGTDGVRALDPATGTELWHFSAATGPVSSPAVIKGFDPQPDPPAKLFVMSMDGNLYVLDTTDGRLLWSAGIGASGIAPLALTCLPPGPCKVVAAAGESVFSYDENGTRLWATILDAEITKSPALHCLPTGPCKVIVAAGSTLSALDADDGSVLWSIAPARGLFGAPAIGNPDTIGDGEIYVGNDAGSLFAVDPDKGTLLDTFTAAGAIFGSPAIGDPNEIVPCVFPADETGTVYELELQEGALTEVWQTKLGAGIVGSPVLANGVLYVTTQEGPEPHLFALDQATGEVLLDMVLSAESLSAPMVADGRVILGIANGDIIAVSGAPIGVCR